MTISLHIVILAAGESKRLGYSKQLLTINSVSLVRRAADTACELSTQFNLVAPIIVTGRDHLDIEHQIKDTNANCIKNEHWAEGMGTSIQCAVDEIVNESKSMKREAAVMLMTCDQVLLSAKLLTPMIKRHLSNTEKIIAASYDQTIGIPAIFPQPIFTILANLEKDQGAKKVIQTNLSQVIQINLPEAAQDLDTLEHEQQVRQLLES